MQIKKSIQNLISMPMGNSEHSMARSERTMRRRGQKRRESADGSQHSKDGEREDACTTASFATADDNMSVGSSSSFYSADSFASFNSGSSGGSSNDALPRVVQIGRSTVAAGNRRRPRLRKDRFTREVRFDLNQTQFFFQLHPCNDEDNSNSNNNNKKSSSNDDDDDACTAATASTSATGDVSVSNEEDLSEPSSELEVEPADKQPEPTVVDDLTDIKWYSEEESTRMKEENTFTLQTICRMSRCSKASPLPQDASSYSGVLMRVYQECCAMTTTATTTGAPPSYKLSCPKLQSELQQQCESWSARRGLEYKVVHYIVGCGAVTDRKAEGSRRRQLELVKEYKCPKVSTAIDKNSQRSTTSKQRSSVLPRFHKKEQEQPAAATPTDPDEAELLRQKCQAISQPARIFAHLLALTQAQIQSG